MFIIIIHHCYSLNFFYTNYIKTSFNRQNRCIVRSDLSSNLTQNFNLVMDKSGFNRVRVSSTKSRTG
ncbi:hypothetical protein HanIR_Chr04g0177541 [Helianthus annuus]|nr:hypothetical protein HanIR_Chr04g0177541 [Helianthus annuus]